MNRVRTALILGLAMAAAADLARAALTPGEVVLTGSDTRTLRDSEDIASYDICVKMDRQAGPVMVMSGSTSKTLAPGECGVITGGHITAMPAKPLPGASHSTVTIHKRD
jgi:hypothetical protein